MKKKDKVGLPGETFALPSNSFRSDAVNDNIAMNEVLVERKLSDGLEDQIKTKFEKIEEQFNLLDEGVIQLEKAVARYDEAGASTISVKWCDDIVEGGDCSGCNKTEPLTIEDITFNNRGTADKLKEIDDEVDKRLKDTFEMYDDFYGTLPRWKKEWFLDIIQLTNKSNESSSYINAYKLQTIDGRFATAEDFKLADIKREEDKKLVAKWQDCFYKWYTPTYIAQWFKYKVVG